MRPVWPLDMAGAAFALVLLGWGAFQQVTATGSVAFGTPELAVVGSLLLAITGALSLVFRLLLGAKDEQIEAQARQIEALQTTVKEVLGLRDGERREMIEMLKTTIEGARLSVDKMTDAVGDMTRMTGQRNERATSEHAEIRSTIERLALMLPSRQRAGNDG